MRRRLSSLVAALLGSVALAPPALETILTAGPTHRHATKTRTLTLKRPKKHTKHR